MLAAPPLAYHPPRRQPWFRPRRLAWAILLLGLAAPAALTLSRNLPRIGLHHDVIYPEAAGAQLALWTAQTGRVFPPLQRPPFTPAIYGPLFYLSLAALARTRHASLFALLLAGRLASLAAYLGLVAIVIFFNRRRGYAWPASLAAGLALAGIPAFSAWIVCARPDLAALFFGILGLWLADGAAGQASERRARAAWLGAGAACAAAWLLKQSFVAAPLAILAWLLWRRRRLAALIFLSVCALPVAVVLGALWLRGEPVLTSLLRLRHALLQPRLGLSILAGELRLPGHLLLLGLGGLGWLRELRSAGRARPLALPAVYFPLAWTLPVWPILQSGGGGNYLFEAWTACALLLPEGLRALAAWGGQIHARLAPDRFRLRPLAALAGLTLLAAAGCGLFFARLLKPSYIVRQRGFASLRRLRPLRVFSSDDYLTIHGRRPEFLDPDLAHILALTGHFSPAPILARLRRRRYDLLLLGIWHGALPAYRGISYYSRAEIRAIRRHYLPVCAAYGLSAWRPRGRPAPITAAALSRTLGRHCRRRPFQLLPDGRYRWPPRPAPAR